MYEYLRINNNIKQMFKYTRLFTRNNISNYVKKTRKNAKFLSSSVNNIKDDKYHSCDIIIVFMTSFFVIMYGIVEYSIYMNKFKTCKKNIKINKKYMIDKFGMTKFYIADQNDNIYNIKTSIENWHKLEIDKEIEIECNLDLDKNDMNYLIELNKNTILPNLLLEEYPTITKINYNNQT